MQDRFTPRNSGVLPMIAAAGAPTRNEIREFLVRYKNAGIQQFLFFGRAGCEYEYLSDRWFEMSADFIELASELDMGVWLYDDYNCPTTYVNGLLPALGPEYQVKYMDIWLEDGQFRCLHKTNPEGGDMLSAKAMDFFISSTYQAYYDRFARYFGTTIRGIFSDEPTQAIIPDRHKAAGHLRFPCYGSIDEDYQRATGRGLESDLDADLRGAGPDDLWPAYWQLIGRRGRVYYADRLRNWCDDHNIYFTGHLYDEHDSEAAVFMNGDPLLMLKGFSFPGMDEIFTETTMETAEWVTLGLVQNAVLARGVGGIAEILSLGPCDMPPAKVRQMIWLTALFGIDQYLIAVAQLNAKGNSTRGSFYGPCNPVQPNFGMYKLLAADARTAVEIAHKTCEYSVSVRFPQTLSARRAVRHVGKHVYDDINELRLLLAGLTRSQIAWRLIGEDEDAGAEPVIEVGNDGYLLNNRYYKLAGLLASLESSVTRKAYVTGIDAQVCGNLCLRTFTDGTAAVVDLHQDERERQYLLHCGSGVRIFTIAGRGVRLFRLDQVQDVDWRISYDSPNLLRCDLSKIKPQFTFVCADEIAAFKLLLRQHGGQPEIALDGVPISAGNPCTALPTGFAELYRETDEFALAAGKHVLTLANDCEEYPYLAGVYLCGAFSVNKDQQLKNGMPAFNYGDLKDSGLADYVGKIILEAQVQVPDAANTTLNLDPDSHYTEVFADGDHLGGRAWAPYQWVIPTGKQGQTISLKVVIAGTPGPMFGEISKLSGITKSYYARQVPGGFGNVGLLSRPYFSS